MVSKASHESSKNPLLDALGHNRDLLLALSRAAQAVQLAREPEEIYRVVGEQIQALGFEATILTFGDDQKHLYYRYTTIQEGIIHAAENLAGLSICDYGWLVLPDSLYGRIIKEGKAEYTPAGDLFAEALPSLPQPLSAALIKMLKTDHGILAPLRVAEEAYGVLVVFGGEISREDLPAMESFAGQVSASLRNALLTQRVENELKERKQVEEALRASKEEIHALLDAIPDMMFILDHKGTFLHYHVSKKQLLYVPTEMFLGKNIRDVMPPQMVEAYISKVEQIVQSGESQLFEYALEMNGGQYYFEAHIVAYQSELVLCVVRDISERKQVEAKLYLQSAALEAAANTIIITDRDGIIQWANSSFGSLTGFEASEAIGTNPRKLMKSGKQSKGFYKDLWDTILSGKIWHNELINRRKDGSHYFEEMTITPLHGADGKISHFIAVKQDISERKKVENDLRQANHSLKLAHSELQQMFEHEQVLARTDGLTGQINRRYFFELALREFNASLRYLRPLTVILFDIDGFKQVNDTFGHAIGDNILTRVARVTATQVREVDVLARYGGDEFIVLLPQTSEQKAFLIAERIREKVACTRMENENSPFLITLSLGVAEITLAPQDVSVEDVIRRADRALYQAKKNGRNHTVMYSEL